MPRAVSFPAPADSFPPDAVSSSSAAVREAIQCLWNAKKSPRLSESDHATIEAVISHLRDALPVLVIVHDNFRRRFDR